MQASRKTPPPVVTRAPDMERVGALLKAVSEDSPDWQSVIRIQGAPPSKSRPRFSRSGHAYTPAEDRSKEVYTASQLKRLTETPLEGNLTMVCIFYRPNRQRIDADNMLKHVCDAATGTLWKDDSQVTAIAGIVEYDPVNPRTIVGIAAHTSTMERGSDASYPCKNCGKPILRSTYATGPLPKCCSPECRQELFGYTSLAVLVPCKQCTEPFKRRASSQVFCSHDCRLAHLTGQRKAKAKPFSTCMDCGKTLAHHRGGRCRECWRKNLAVRLTVICSSQPRKPPWLH